MTDEEKIKRFYNFVTGRNAAFGNWEKDTSIAQNPSLRDAKERRKRNPEDEEVIIWTCK